MPRDLVLGNGQMLITLDAEVNMRDLYYPYVGLWNHIGGHRSAVGVWSDGDFAWLSDPCWSRRLGYCRESLVADVEARNDAMGLSLRLNAAVHYQENVYLCRIELTNLRTEPREVRLFFHQDYSIDETDVGDTAVYDPAAGVLYHYKRDRYIMVDGQGPEGGIFEFATGVKRFRGAEGTWRDAEDGRLEGHPISQGSVDSTVSFRLELQGGARDVVWSWISLGRSYGQVLRLDHRVRAAGPEPLMAQIKSYWQQWVNKTASSFADLPEDCVRLYKQSLPIIRAHVDKSGAITAANDSDILQYNRDHYSYVWPRDGAFVALALTQAGYPELAAPFFTFCARALTAGGFLLQKYNPDGSAGSCWHPWVHGGRRQLPIQEDETALVLWALWAHYERSRDIELVLSLATTLIEPAAEFLTGYLYPHLNLPRETYDLWEERRGIHTWTASAVVAGLEAAGNLVRVLGDEARAQRYWQVAQRIRLGIVTHLYDPGLGRFVRGLSTTEDGELLPDPVADASIAGLVLFDVLSAGDPRVSATMRALEEALWVGTETGGLARYVGDVYFRNAPDDGRVPGNPWFITTLWLATWHVEAAQRLDELERARELLAWVARSALPSGVLPEQIDPLTGAPLSVAPLCWSHAGYVLAVRRYLAQYERLRERRGNLAVTGP